jgi:hypothetical protein
LQPFPKHFQHGHVHATIARTSFVHPHDFDELHKLICCSNSHFLLPIIIPPRIRLAPAVPVAIDVCLRIAMSEYQQVYTHRGRLFFIPEHLHDPSRARRSLYQGRGRRPHRIHIARVPPDPTFYRRQTSSSKSYITAKLAAPRDNAKRFLRSFIDTHFTPPQTDDITSPRTSTSSNRTSLASPPDSTRWSWATSEMRSSPRNSVGAVSAASGVRPALPDTHRSSGRSSAKSIINSSVRALPEEKPLASGNGINIGISLTEPVLFLQGFEHTETSDRSTAMLRGTLNLRVTKPTKIKAITLKFRGKSTTKWPEGQFCGLELSVCC